MPITRIDGLEPLAEVERALLVVEVLHAPHPELGGLLLGLGEHFCTQKEFRSASRATDKTHMPNLQRRGIPLHNRQESSTLRSCTNRAADTYVSHKHRKTRIFCHRTTRPCEQALPVKRHLAQGLRPLAPHTIRELRPAALQARPQSVCDAHCDTSVIVCVPPEPPPSEGGAPRRACVAWDLSSVERGKREGTP